MARRLGQRKQQAAACLMSALTLLLTACQGGGVPLRTETPVALPTAATGLVAPIGDAALEYTAPATLYLPQTDGTHLISVTADIPCSAARLEAESIVRALLQYPGEGLATSLGGEVKLALYGANPVEVSGNVATVNLAASALQLDRKSLYVCGQAIANTLCELKSIQYVNLLVMDKQIGLDLASTLPAGALSRSLSANVGAVYEQALSQRVKPGEDPEGRQFNATVALYFPLSALNGVMAEARNVSFSGQSPETMITQILRELSEGPVSVSGSPAIPLLAGLLLEPPVVEEPADGAGKTVTLRFDVSLWDMIQNLGVSRASLTASLCYTLATFIPNVTGIVVYVGNERVDHVMLGATEGLLFESGIERRSHFAPLLMDNATLYFANADATALVATQRPMPYYRRANPRALLLALFGGPSAADSVQGLSPALTTGILSDADILGLSISEHTLLVNLSANTEKLGSGVTGAGERLMAYAMVNTLLCFERARSVCFFENGNPMAGFTGEIDWSGYFYPNTGLVHAQ